MVNQSWLFVHLTPLTRHSGPEELLQYFCVGSGVGGAGVGGTGVGHDK